MTNVQQPLLSHVGIYVWDLPLMVEFYQKVFGMIVTDRGIGRSVGAELVFLSGSPEHHHQLVLATGRPGDTTFSTIMQLSFLVPSIQILRDVRDRAVSNGAKGLLCLNHGTSLSVYADDPEGNRLEIYYETPFYIPQPYGDPLDLDQSDDSILQRTEELCRSNAGFMLRDDWKYRFIRQSHAVRLDPKSNPKS